MFAFEIGKIPYLNPILFPDFNTRPERIHPGAAKLLFRTGFLAVHPRTLRNILPQTTDIYDYRVRVLKPNKSFPHGHFHKA